MRRRPASPSPQRARSAAPASPRLHPSRRRRRADGQARHPGAGRDLRTRSHSRSPRGPGLRRGDGQIMDLTVVWAFLIAFGVAMYVVMDGFDLGIGILFPLLPVGRERDQAMNAVAPVWDGNETWLVLGGGGLLAAFPLAYAIVLPALYAPLIAMLLGLVFRGVAFEYRWRDPRHRKYWDTAFFVGSLVATFMQGVTLGALLHGIRVDGRAYAGGWWNWLSLYSL